MSKIRNPLLDNARLLLKRTSQKSGAKIWLKASKTLSKSISRKPKVNVGKIDQLTNKDSIVLIPGKVLGGGTVSHKIIIGAYSFTKSAEIKIQNAGGKALLIPEFLEEYSTKKDVMLIGG